MGSPAVLAATEEAKLTPSDGRPSDHFGTSVSLSGSRALLGASLADEAGLSYFGAAYVFVRNGSGWTQEAKLERSDGSGGDRFGHSVSLSGDRAIIGSYLDDDGGFDSGSAYVFTRDGTTWPEQAKLTASDAAAGDRFGHAVAISGDTAIVGAPFHDANGAYSGATYAFRWDGAEWLEEATLLADDGDVGDQFGHAVAVDGDTALIGALGDAGNRGAAYVFVRSGSTWTQQAKLVAAGPQFGLAVALSGDTALVSSTSWNGGRGTAYVFTRSGSAWAQEAALTASDAAAYDAFGRSVAVSEDVALVGADGDDDNGLSTGAAYLFSRSESTWTQEVKLLGSDSSGSHAFGSAVSVHGNTGLVGALGAAGSDGNTGAAYVFDLELNSPPTALAGADQSIHAGDLVALDGTGSYDDDSAALSFAWSFESRPDGSTATLSGADTATPSFVADLSGTYFVSLVVTDEDGLASSPDTVSISSLNLAPTADAGSAAGTYVGDLVTLDGSGSFDPDGDALSWRWSLVARADGSTAVLSDADQPTPSFTPDVVGDYTAELIVNDGFVDSVPSAVTVSVVTAEDYAQVQLLDSLTTTVDLTAAEVTTPGNQEALGNFVQQAIAATQEGDSSLAIHKIEEAQERTDGCVLRGTPDGNGPGRDWITDCAEQQVVWNLLQDALEALQ